LTCHEFLTPYYIDHNEAQGVRTYLFGLLLCWFFFLSLGLPAQDRLAPADIQRVMGELLEYHIKVKEITPALIQRSYEIYLQQFDSNKLYLLESEVRPFLQPTKEELQEAFAKYRAGDVSDYGQLDGVMQAGILRARSWRPELMAEARERLLRDQSEPPTNSRAEALYCANEEQLRRRQQEALLAFGLVRLENRRAQACEEEIIRDAWELYLKQANQRECPYLHRDTSGEALAAVDEQHYLVERVLKALAQSLDSHTAYYSPAEAYQLRLQLQQEYTGVGLELEDAAEGVEVARVLEGGPAAKSGKIRPRDRIVRIDGQPIAHLPYSDVLAKIRGRKGSWVLLGIQRRTSKGQEDFIVRLQRDHLPASSDELASTFQYFGEGIIGVVRLNSFYEGLGVSAEQDVRRALQAFRRQAPLVGLVLDLRLNLGGFLSQAVKVAGLFITNGVIAVSKYADGIEVYFRDIDGVALYDGPLVILTSKVSASAAEIVAQSLQDYGQALVVGDSRTYGKGSIQHQTITDSDARDYYKVTVGRYYTVSGRSTQVTGVQADLVVPTILANERIGEEYLEYPLEPDQIQPAFDDSLQDLDPIIRAWFVKYYLPTLQQQRSTWKESLPLLKKNSEHRLRTSQNYQLFLESLQDSDSRSGANTTRLPPAYGRDDLQLIEAINILKDMILLQGATAKAA
jgi:carboxyl-terminal processing protease